MEIVAFACIPTGGFRSPQRRAAEIAVDTVRKFLENDDRVKKVVFNVFKDEDRRIYEEILGR